MEPEFSELKVLVNLGLTLVQAKVYLALIASGPSKTSVISRISKVAQPDIYQNLSKLHSLGLVEKIIAKPFKYRAIPMKEGLSLLLKTRTAQYEKVRAETRMLLRKAKKKKQKSPKEDFQYILIPGGRTVIDRIKTAIEKTQLSMDLLLSWKRFAHGMASKFVESMEIAWAKKVKIRFIIESPSKSKIAKELIQHCREKPSCQIRFMRDHPKIVLGIYDLEEVFLIANPKKDLPGSPALWSNNPSLIALAEDHFETLWLTAMESID